MALTADEQVAADEQTAAEGAIVALNAERKLLINEQAQAGAITSNLRSLLGLDLDGDSAETIDRAIAALGTNDDTDTEVAHEGGNGGEGDPGPNGP